MTRVRPPAAAGSFYPAQADRLRSMIRSLTPAGSRRKAKAVLLPHAGYDYSGRVTGAVLSQIEIPRDVILLSFSHRGIGPSFGMWSGGAWRTPLGEIGMATDVAARIRAEVPYIQDDEAGFLGEHSGEVQVPFLQELRPGCRIVPLALNAWVGGRSGEAELEAFGAALAGLVKDELVLATTDLTHCGEAYGVEPPPGVTPRDFARGQDRAILQTIQALSLPDFFATRQRMGISMCGVSPTAAFIAFGRAAGAASADLVSYATSADDEPDADRAVGYPGAVIWA